jgi:hypothetical protein
LVEYSWIVLPHFCVDLSDPVENIAERHNFYSQFRYLYQIPFFVRKALILCFALCLTGAFDGYCQSDQDLQAKLGEMKGQMTRLEEVQDSVGTEIAILDEQIEEIQYELALARFDSSGYSAVIRSDQCDLSMSGSQFPEKGDKVVVIGATHQGLWRISYRDEVGLAQDHCLKFTDRRVDPQVLRIALMAEAQTAYEAEQRRMDSIATEERLRKDSIEAAELVRLAAQVEKLEADYDAIGKTNYPLRIHDVSIAEMNSVGGVTVGITAQYFKKAKDIKYLYFTLVPYNSVGDKVACSIRGTSEFIGRVTGPVSAQYDPLFWFWETAWYNSAITCIKVSKVKIEYTDGTSYTYAREVQKILGEFDNLCAD